MSIYINIWTRSVVAAVDIPEGVFVKEDGTLGGCSGVSAHACSKGNVASILTIGEATVKVANSQNISAGDWVTGDNSGLATKSSAVPNAYCKALTASKEGLVRVLLK
ncbi:hypothetical protein SAMN02745150_01185 [Brevinema andersonii]|uniref:DUF2190 family protein n=1 Tax=Brevinema andersonii TaxID=34097 RepID=A0A1I1EU69_BREAD|nr:DUF2190 family protein [Brevinema andersonii]SFB88453.1 hypothetical protein SAMN02745150_01185 [Brevinema andersonii]